MSISHLAVDVSHALAHCGELLLPDLQHWHVPPEDLVDLYGGAGAEGRGSSEKGDDTHTVQRRQVHAYRIHLASNGHLAWRHL